MHKMTEDQKEPKFLGGTAVAISWQKEENIEKDFTQIALL
jgi:hypothetical protein